MKAEEHIKAYVEHRDVVDWAINRGVEQSQRTIGTHAFRSIVELLSAYLHKINKIDIGFQINHRWFKGNKVEERLPDFPDKKIIIHKMIELENKSENLSYGSQKPKEEIKEVIRLMNELATMLEGLMKNEK